MLDSTETARLVLRDHTPDDAEAALAIEEIRLLGGVQQRNAEMRACLETMSARYDAYGSWARRIGSMDVLTRAEWEERR